MCYHWICFLCKQSTTDVRATCCESWESSQREDLTLSVDLQQRPCPRGRKDPLLNGQNGHLYLCEACSITFLTQGRPVDRDGQWEMIWNGQLICGNPSAGVPYLNPQDREFVISLLSKCILSDKS